MESVELFDSKLLKIESGEDVNDRVWIKLPASDIGAPPCSICFDELEGGEDNEIWLNLETLEFACGKHVKQPTKRRTE